MLRIQQVEMSYYIFALKCLIKCNINLCMLYCTIKKNSKQTALHDIASLQSHVEKWHYKIKLNETKIKKKLEKLTYTTVFSNVL
jgi:hypothetical protein